MKRRDMIPATRHETQLNAGKYDEKTQFKLALYSSDEFSLVQFIWFIFFSSLGSLVHPIRITEHCRCCLAKFL